MNICIMGAGYVGLTFALWKLKSKNVTKVYCYDINPFIIKRLNAGKPHFYEGGLEQVLQVAIETKKIEFRNFFNSIPHCEEYYICVGTPALENGDCNTKYVFDAVEELKLYVKKPAKVYIRSTVAIGTTRKVQIMFKEAKKQIEVIHYPEFLAQGSAFSDLDTNRHEFGTEYGNSRYESTEVAKYACNAFLATKISFMNYIAAICEKEGADIEVVKDIMKKDYRIGANYLNAGIGFGGSCFPKDVNYMRYYEETNLGFNFFGKVLEINELQPLWVIEKLNKNFPDLQGKKVAIWGLSFKPGTDDIRNSPSTKILEYLTHTQATISVYCPLGMENTRVKFKNKLHYAPFKEKATEGADCLIVCTDYEEFKQAQIGLFQSGMVVIDGRNVFNKQNMKAMGLKYYGVGRPS